MKKLLLICLTLIGCNIQDPTEQANEISYYKDHRTNLCFVQSHVISSNGIMFSVFSYVPCTPEVEKLIVAK